MEARALRDSPGERFRRSGRALVEREAALGLIAGALTDARAGRGSVVYVEGPHGTGKTSLLSYAGGLARQTGMTVLEARGHELEQDFAYGVLLQLFEARVTRADDGDELLTGGAGLALPLFDETPSEIGPDRAHSVLHGLYWLCANLATDQPLAVIVDDADLTDLPSRLFLPYLARRIEALPAVLVVAAGSALKQADGDILVQTASHASAARCRLEPLSLHGTTQLLRQTRFRHADPAFCRALHNATAGNPRLTQQVASLLEDAGVEGNRASGELVASFAPDAISTATLARIAPLGGAAGRLLRAAAVLGDSTELRVAAELAGLEVSDAAAAATLLVGAGLLAPEERLTFVHPVVRRALDADGAPVHRAEQHRRAAEILFEDGAPSEVVGGHLLGATRSGSGWAVEALCAAADDARSRGASTTARRYLQRAIAEPPPRERRAYVEVALGRAEAAAGELRGVDRLTDASMRLPDATDRARAALEAGQMAHALGSPTHASAAFARGIGQIPDGAAPALRERLEASLGAITRLGRLRDGLPATAEPLTAAPGSLAELGQLAQMGLEAALRGEPRARVRDLAERALGRGRLLQDSGAEGVEYTLACLALTVAEDLQAAEVALTAAVEEGRARGSFLGVATVSWVRSFAILRRGRLSDAAVDARAALAAESKGWRIGSVGARWVLANVSIMRAELHTAEGVISDMAQATESDAPDWVAVLSARSALALARRDSAGALTGFTECGDRLASLGITNPAFVSWRSGAARAAAIAGDRDEAARLAEAELALAERFDAPGPVGHALRALAVARGGRAGLEALEEAVRRTEESHALLERAAALVDYGAAMRRYGSRREAREPLRRGHQLALRCGATALVEAAHRESIVAGARPRRTALEGPEALTAREQQVAALAAEGLSNREIAEALFVTVKTVEWHLKHTYVKLGVKSRAELRNLPKPPEA